MPSILLDHHIDEAAMRATEPDQRPRRERRRATKRTATVAGVVANALHLGDEFADYREATHDAAVQTATGQAAATRRVHCKPGTSNRVIADLRDEAPIMATSVEENAAAILAAVECAPFVRHEAAFLMVLAPVIAMLAETEPVAVDDLPDWIQENLARPHGKFRAAIHRSAKGVHLTSIEPDVAVDTVTGEPVHFCHQCDDDTNLRRSHACWAPDSTITILTMAAARTVPPVPVVTRVEPTATYLRALIGERGTAVAR